MDLMLFFSRSRGKIRSNGFGEIVQEIDLEEQIWKNRFGRTDLEEQIWKNRIGRTDLEEQIWKNRFGRTDL